MTFSVYKSSNIIICDKLSRDCNNKYWRIDASLDKQTISRSQVSDATVRGERRLDTPSTHSQQTDQRSPKHVFFLNVSFDINLNIWDTITNSNNNIIRLWKAEK